MPPRLPHSSSLPPSLSPSFFFSLSLSLLLLTRFFCVAARFLRAGDGGEQWTVDQYDTVAPKVMEADATFGKSGYKTIAIAIAVGDGPMKYAGTLPIMDPPRADTAETIKKIKMASVDVKMITGDHLNIAKELARQIDLGVNIHLNLARRRAPRATILSRTATASLR